MASHRAWLSAAQLSRQFFQSARYVRPTNSVVNDSSERPPSAPHPAVSLLPLFTCVPPPPLTGAVKRRFSTSLPRGKKYHEAENEFAHEVMSSLPAYRRTLHYHVLGGETLPDALPDHRAGWGAQAAAALVGAMRRLQVGAGEAAAAAAACAEPSPADPALTSSCAQYSDDQIVRLLAALCSWPPGGQPDELSFRRLWQALDAECCRRLSAWDSERALLVADLWYRLQVSRLTQYSGHMLEQLGRRLSQLTPSQLVQYLFFVNLSRRLGGVRQLDLERKILQCLPVLSVDELGIICMSFFKTQTALQLDELVDAIVYKLLNSVETAKPETVCAVLKLLRLSVPARRWQVLECVYERLLPLVDGFNSLVQLHLLLLGTQALVHHPAAVVRLTAHLHGQLANIRLKDVERLLFVTMLFNFDPGVAFFQDVVSDLRSERRAEERKKYPKCLMSCLMYLAYHRVYPADLIATVVSPAFISSINESMLSSYSGLERELTALSCTLELELPGFVSELPQDYQQKHLKKHLSRVPRPGMTRPTFAENTQLAVRAALVELLGGADRVAALHVLPHFVTPDMVVCLDGSGQAVPLPPAFVRQPALAAKLPLAGLGRHWVCVVVGGRSCYTRNNQHPVGNFLMRLRQLQLVGYSVLEVPWYEFQDKSHRLKYLRRKLQQLSVLPPPLQSPAGSPPRAARLR